MGIDEPDFEPTPPLTLSEHSDFGNTLKDMRDKLERFTVGKHNLYYRQSKRKAAGYYHKQEIQAIKAINNLMDKMALIANRDFPDNSPFLIYGGKAKTQI